MSLEREVPEKRESAWIAYENDDLDKQFRMIDGFVTLQYLPCNGLDVNSRKDIWECPVHVNKQFHKCLFHLSIQRM